MKKKFVEEPPPVGDGLVVKVSGTSPLSFSVKVGTVLQVKQIGASKHTRPTIGSGFKTDSFLLFMARTKIGNISYESLESFGDRVPITCTVCAVKPESKAIYVSFSETSITVDSKI